MRKLGMSIVAVVASASLAGCSDTAPSAQVQADEVQRLATHVVPVVDELDVSFYLDEGSSCHSILYARGEFRDGGSSCGSPTEKYGPFDARVRTDFDKVQTAIKTSGVPTHRFDATLTGDGVLGTASFPREDSSWRWNWSYLYDPHDTLAKARRRGDPEMGAPVFTEITDHWWLVMAVDD